MISFNRRVFSALDRRTGHVMSRLILKQQVLRVGKGDCRIIIGAGGIKYSGWIPTQIQTLNILKQSDWEKYFIKNSINAMVAEHVWEHLTLTEGKLAASNCYTYLKADGYVRIAVPDGLHPNPSYIENVRAGGCSPGAKDHKVLYAYKTLFNVFESAGFEVKLLEYYDESGQFHFRGWDVQDGFILRSKRYDQRNKNGELNYTSIILDATKRTS